MVGGDRMYQLLARRDRAHRLVGRRGPRAGRGVPHRPVIDQVDGQRRAPNKERNTGPTTAPP